MLVREVGNVEVPLLASLGPKLAPIAAPFPVGELDGRPCLAVALPPDVVSDGDLSPRGLRELFARLDERQMTMAVRASEIVEWYLAHAFCGRCGEATELHDREMARACRSCGALHFPRISPAVITLVHRRDSLLLARNHSFPPGFYALLAGFVEPGETLEEAVAREVKEEVGLDVADLRYFASQAWPFPSQLMVGFFARCSGGELRLQEDEIAEARWFPLDRLPDPAHRPPLFTIAGRLIQSFADGLASYE